jgi:shikimate dehydrogenase
MQPSNFPTFKLGLIGHPLSHSLSPKIHTAALKACGLQGDYSLFSVHPDDKQTLKDLLDRVRTGEISGLNVTIPHKQNVIRLLDELTHTAQAIGAVNTIYLRKNRLIGDNTDAPGFLTDLKRVFNFSALSLQPSALVLGAGGAARAIVYALLNDGWEVTTSARRIEQSNELANQFEKVKILEHDVQTLKLVNAQLIVNTTPVGMTPNVDQSPWPENIPFPTTASIYDLIYNPHDTKLVQAARRQGLRATTGLGMLIEQAGLSFEIWTGHHPSREIMRACIEQSPVFNYQSPATNQGAF